VFSVAAAAASCSGGKRASPTVALLLHARLQDCDLVCEDVPVTVHELQCQDVTTEVEQCVNVPKQSCEKVGCWWLSAVWMLVQPSSACT
jgi:hypothetical protein